MKRVIVIGNNGSGKSVFSEKLGNKLNIPVIHLDKHFHKPGWKTLSDEEWDEKLSDLIKGDWWVMDGTYPRTLAIRVSAADTIIFLDLPKWLTFSRLVKRRIIGRNKPRPDLPDFLSERLSWQLLKKNLTFSRKKFIDKLEEYSKNKDVFILHNSKEIDRFFEKL